MKRTLQLRVKNLRVVVSSGYICAKNERLEWTNIKEVNAILEHSCGKRLVYIYIQIFRFECFFIYTIYRLYDSSQVVKIITTIIFVLLWEINEGKDRLGSVPLSIHI